MTYHVRTLLGNMMTFYRSPLHYRLPLLHRISMNTLLLLILFTQAGYALSMGAVKITSKPGEKFRAYTTAETGGREGFSVTIGSAADYQKMDIDRPGFIDNIKVVIKKHPSNPAEKIIFLMSDRAIEQPSFNLLLKAKLGGGTILENYFLALDYQKNMTLESSKDDENALKRIAEEISLMKQETLSPDGVKPEKAKKPKGVQTPQKSEDMIERFREEEKSAISGNFDEDILTENIDEEPLVNYEAKQSNPPTKLDVPKIAKIKTKPVVKPVVVKKAHPPEDIHKDRPDQRTGGIEGSYLPVDISRPETLHYDVVKGDMLYRVARKLGADRNSINRVVLAIFLSNRKSFVRNNVHGVMASADLDLSKVNDIAGKLDEREAGTAISKMWDAWRSREDTSSIIANVDPGNLLLDGMPEEKMEKPVEPKKEPTYKHKPFVVHVASYRKRKEAFEVVTLLRRKGLNSFISAIKVKDKGDFYRVLVDRISTKNQATLTAKEVKEKSGFGYARVLKLPFAIQIGSPAERLEISDRLKLLLEDNYSTYMIPAKSDNRYRLLTGAFQSMEQAEESVISLVPSDMEYEIVEP